MSLTYRQVLAKVTTVMVTRIDLVRALARVVVESKGLVTYSLNHQAINSKSCMA